MAVSHFYGAYTPSEYFPVVGDVKLLERFGSMMQCDRQELSVQEDQVTQAKAGAFFKFLEGSCATGLVGGAFGSLLMQHPLPLLIGLSQCLPGIRAQQKVGGEFRINTYTSERQAYPTVAFLRDGNVIVVWHSNVQDGSGHGIYGQLLDKNGAKIGSEFRVNTNTADDQIFPSVTSLNNGNFVVAWPSGPAPYKGLCQIFHSNGSKLGSDFQFASNLKDVFSHPPIVNLKNGNFIVAWPGPDGSGTGVFGQLFNESGSKIRREFRMNAYESNNQNIPAIAGSNNGKFVVVWQSDWQDGSGFDVYGQLFDENDTKIGNEFQVNTYTADDQIAPVVANMRDDHFIVVWQSEWQDGDGFGIYGQIFAENGARIGTEFQVNTYTANNQDVPHIAGLINDHFIVVWASALQDGDLDGVYGQLFEKNGAKIGNEFQINTYITTDQEGPFVADLHNGNFIVTWHSWGQDGSWWGVYGQIFHDNLNFTSSTRTTSTFQTTTLLTTSSNPSNSGSSTSTTQFSAAFQSFTHEGSSLSSNRNNNYVWFLLGASGWVACLVNMIYLFYKTRRQNKEGNALELSERGTSRAATPPEGSRASQEGEYQYTPNYVTAEV